MISIFKKVLAFSIVLLSVLMLWPLWPSQQYRNVFLLASVRLLLILATLYGTLAFADFIRDRRDKGML
jgi:uncharacterized membrane protein YqjE